MFGVNDLKVLVGELSSLSVTDLATRTGLTRGDVEQLKLRNQRNVKFALDKHPEKFAYNFLYPSKSAAQAARGRRKAEIETELKPRQEQQRQREVRGPLGDFLAAGRGALRGFTADTTALGLQQRGLDPMLAYTGVEMEDPAYQFGSQFGYGYGQTLFPSAASVPGNIVGAGVGSSLLGAGAGLLGLGPVGVGLARGVGALAGGFGGAMGTGYIGQKLMPSARLDPRILGTAQQTMGGPAQYLGQMAGQLSVYSPLQQTPTGRLSAFEGTGMRGFVGKAMRRGLGEAIADPESVGAPIDLASRAAEVVRGITDREESNRNARIAFMSVNGRAPENEDELIPFGFKTNAQAMTEMASNALLSGITRGGKFLGGISGIPEGGQPATAPTSLPASIAPNAAPVSSVSAARSANALPNPGNAFTFPTLVQRAGGAIPHTVSFNIKPGSPTVPTAANVTPAIGWGTTQLRNSFNGALSSGRITFADNEGNKSVRGIDPNGNFIIEVVPPTGLPSVQIVGFGSLPADVASKLQDAASKAGVKNNQGKVDYLDLKSLSGQTGTYSVNYDASQFPDASIYDHAIKINGTAVSVNVQSINGDQATVQTPSGLRITLPVAGVVPKNTTATGPKVSPKISPFDPAGMVDSNNNPVIVKVGKDNFVVSPESRAAYNNAPDEASRLQSFNQGYIDASAGLDDATAGSYVGSIVDLGSLFRPSKSGKSKTGVNNHYAVVTDVSKIKINGQDAYIAQVQSITNPLMTPVFAPMSVVRPIQPAARTRSLTPLPSQPAPTQPTQPVPAPQPAFQPNPPATPTATPPATPPATPTAQRLNIEALLDRFDAINQQLDWDNNPTPEQDAEIGKIRKQLEALGVSDDEISLGLKARADQRKLSAASGNANVTPAGQAPKQPATQTTQTAPTQPTQTAQGPTKEQLLDQLDVIAQQLDSNPNTALAGEFDKIRKQLLALGVQNGEILNELNARAEQRKLASVSGNANVTPAGQASTQPATQPTQTAPTQTAPTQVTPNIDVSTMGMQALLKLKAKLESYKRPNAQHKANLKAVDDRIAAIQQEQKEYQKNASQNRERNFKDPVSKMSDERLEEVLKFFQNEAMLRAFFGEDATESINRYKEIEQEIARRASAKGTPNQQGATAPTATTQAATEPAQPKPAQQQQPQSNVLLPEDFEHPYDEQFKDIAKDEDLPAEMRSAERGGETFAYRRQTAGEEMEPGGSGHFSAIPRQMWSGFKRFAGFFRFKGKDIGIDIGDLDFEVDLGTGISSREDFKARLVDVYGQSDAQAEALSQWVDRWALAWAREMMRISGVRTMDTYRAARIKSDPAIQWKKDASGNLIIPKNEEWKQYFFEQQAPRTDQKTVEMMHRLVRYFYGNRLGNISALSTPVMGSPGFTQGFYNHQNDVMNIAFALKGQGNFAAQVHEVNHLLVRSLYGPMYHQLVSRMLSLQDYKTGQTILEIDPSAEERIVTALTLSLLKGKSGTPFAESYEIGGTVNDPFLGKLFGDLGSLLLEAANKTDDDYQKITKHKGWKIPITNSDRNAIFGKGAVIPAGTTLIVEDSEGVERFFVVSERFMNQSGDIRAIYGRFEGQDPNSKADSIRPEEVVAFGESFATIGTPYNGEHLSDHAQQLIAKWLGHWSDFQNELFDTVNIGAPKEEEFNPVGAINLARGTVGYQWWQNADYYRAHIGKGQEEFSDNRVRGRFRYTHFGWLDSNPRDQNPNPAGYEAYRSFDDIRDWEWNQAAKIAFSSGTPPNDPQVTAQVKAASEPTESKGVPRSTNGSSAFMSTLVTPEGEGDDKEQGLPESVVSAFLSPEGHVKQEIEDAADEVKLKDITEQLLAVGVDRYILQRADNRNDNQLIQRIMALPLTGIAVRQKYNDQFSNMEEALRVQVGWPYYIGGLDKAEISRQVFSIDPELDRAIENNTARLFGSYMGGILGWQETRVKRNEKGEIVYKVKLDEQGNPQTDAEGKPVYEKTWDGKKIAEREFEPVEDAIRYGKYTIRPKRQVHLETRDVEPYQTRMPSGQRSEDMRNAFWDNIQSELSITLSNISVEDVQEIVVAKDGKETTVTNKQMVMWVTTPSGYSYKRYVTPEFVAQQLRLAVARGAQKGALEYRVKEYGVPKPQSVDTVIGQIAKAQNMDQAYIEYAKSEATSQADRNAVDSNDFLRRMRIRTAYNSWIRMKSNNWVTLDQLNASHLEIGKGNQLATVKKILAKYLDMSGGDVNELSRMIVSDHRLRVVHSIHHTAGNLGETLMRVRNGNIEIANINNGVVESRAVKNKAIDQLDEYERTQALNALSYAVSIDSEMELGRDAVDVRDAYQDIIDIATKEKPKDEIEFKEKSRAIRQALVSVSSNDFTMGLEGEYEVSGMPSFVARLDRLHSELEFDGVPTETMGGVLQGAKDFSNLLSNIDQYKQEIQDTLDAISVAIAKKNKGEALTQNEEILVENPSLQRQLCQRETQALDKLANYIRDERIEVAKQAQIDAKNAGILLDGMFGDFDKDQKPIQIESIEMLDEIVSEVALGAENFSEWAASQYIAAEQGDVNLIWQAVSYLQENNIPAPDMSNAAAVKQYFKDRYNAFSIAAKMLSRPDGIGTISETINPLFAELSPELTLREMAAGMMRMIARARGEENLVSTEKLLGQIKDEEREAFTIKCNRIETEKMYSGLNPESAESRALDFIRASVFGQKDSVFKLTELGSLVGLKHASIAERMYAVFDLMMADPKDPRLEKINKDPNASKQFGALKIQLRGVLKDPSDIWPIINRIGSACVITPTNFKKASWSGERFVSVDKNIGNTKDWANLIKPDVVKRAVVTKLSYNQILGSINKPMYDRIESIRKDTNLTTEQKLKRTAIQQNMIRTVLSDSEIASLVALDTHLTDVQRAVRFRELVNGRDESIRSSINQHLKKEAEVQTASTIRDYNAAMDQMNLSREERLACMGSLIRAMSRQHLNNVVDFTVANGKLPTPDDLKEMVASGVKMEKLERELKDAQAVVREFGLEMLVNGAVGARIRVSEIASDQIQADVTGITFAHDPNHKAASMAMIDGMAARSVKAQIDLLSTERVIDAFDDVEVAKSLDVQRQIELLKGTKLSELIFADKVKTVGRSDTPGIARGARSVPAYPGKDLAKRVFVATAKAMSGIFDAIGAGDNFDVFAKSTTLAGLDPKALVAMLGTIRSPEAEANDKSLPNETRKVRVALAKVVDAFADTVVKSNVRVIESLNDVSLDEYDYVLRNSDSRIVDVMSGNRRVYQIDYVNARVKEYSPDGLQHRYVTGESAGAWTSIDLNPLPPLNRAEVAMMNLIMDGMPSDMSMEASTQIRARVSEAIHSYDGLRTVPAVYWSGRNRIHNTSVNTNEPMFHARSIMDDAAQVAEKFGVLSKEAVDNIVLPVISAWKNPDRNNVIRLRVDNNNLPYFDGEGYTVYDKSGNRSQVYARLIAAGLSPEKALEVYAQTDGPAFSQFADDAGGLVEAVMMSNPGMMVHQVGRTPLRQTEWLIKQQGIRIDLKHALTRYEENPTQENLDRVKLHFDDLFAPSQQELDKMIARIKDPGTRNMEIAAVRELANAQTKVPKTCSKFIKTYDAYKAAETEIKTGQPFTTLGFISNHAWNDDGRQAFDLGTGLYDNEQRNNLPYWIRFKNPIVVDIEGGSITSSTIKEVEAIMKDVKEGKTPHDGVVFLNVRDSMRSAASRTLAFSTDFSNILKPHDMLVGPKAPTETKRMLRSSVTPLFMSTIPSPQTGAPAPVPTVQGAVATRDITAGEWFGKTGSRVLDEAQSIARFALSLDWAFTTIQGGKALLGFATDPFNIAGRRNETLIALQAFLGSLNGMKPNMQITLPGGKKLGPDKMGRRAWIETYMNLRQDPLWDLMRQMNVPLHMLNFEKRVEAEKQRRYELANGTIRYEDIAVNMLDFDERGNMTEFYEQNTLMGQLPLVGMFERQMSLQHDLLLFGLIKNQIAMNPHMKNIMSQPDGMEKLANDNVARTMVNFIATSMGDFQYSTNERVDAIAGRVGKAVLAAPRWYFANLAINPLVNLAGSWVYNNIPAAREAFGPGLRGANLYAHKNAKLVNYQLNTWAGTAAAWWVLQTIAEILGRTFGRPDITGDPYKMGSFRIGNWKVSESTGIWDSWNFLTQMASTIYKGGYETRPRPGETLAETNTAYISNALTRLGYKASPLITRGLSLVTGRDVIGRAIYKPDREMITGIEDLYAQVAPVMRLAGFPVPSTINGEAIPFTSVMMSGMLPASWQENWQSYNRATFHNPGDKQVAQAIAINQFIASFMGTQIKYDRYIPDEAQGLWRTMQLFKRKSDVGPTGYEVMSGGMKNYLNYALFGKP